MVDSGSFLVLRIFSLIVQSLVSLTIGFGATMVLSVLWALLFLWFFVAVPPEAAPPALPESAVPAPVPEAIPLPSLPEREGRAPAADPPAAGLV